MKTCDIGLCRVSVDLFPKKLQLNRLCYKMISSFVSLCLPSTRSCFVMISMATWEEREQQFAAKLDLAEDHLEGEPTPEFFKEREYDSPDGAADEDGTPKKVRVTFFQWRPQWGKIMLPDGTEADNNACWKFKADVYIALWMDSGEIFVYCFLAEFEMHDGVMCERADIPQLETTAFTALHRTRDENPDNRRALWHSRNRRRLERWNILLDVMATWPILAPQVTWTMIRLNYASRTLWLQRLLMTLLGPFRMPPGSYFSQELIGVLPPPMVNALWCCLKTMAPPTTHTATMSMAWEETTFQWGESVSSQDVSTRLLLVE